MSCEYFCLFRNKTYLVRKSRNELSMDYQKHLKIYAAICNAQKEQQFISLKCWSHLFICRAAKSFKNLQ